MLRWLCDSDAQFMSLGYWGGLKDLDTLLTGRAFIPSGLDKELLDRKGPLPVHRRPFRSGGDRGGPVHTLHTD